VIADLIAYLEADATLQTILGGGNGNTRIFEQRLPKGDLTPCIYYSITNDGGEEILDSVTVNFNAVAESYTTARNIADRLTALLDRQYKVTIPSSTFKIFYGKKVGGTDAWVPERDHHEMPRLFLFKFIRQTTPNVEDPSQLFTYFSGYYGVRKDTYATLKSSALVAPDDLFVAWATDTEQYVLYTGNVAIGDAGFVVIG